MIRIRFTTRENIYNKRNCNSIVLVIQYISGIRIRVRVMISISGTIREIYKTKKLWL